MVWLKTQKTLTATFNAKQVLAFQKSWRSFSPITVCILAQCQCLTRGRGGWGVYDPPEKAVGVLKIAHYMILRVYGNGLFGLVEVWGGLGYFGVFFFSMDRTTVMLTVK